MREIPSDRDARYSVTAENKVEEGEAAAARSHVEWTTVEMP
jgi:hypothetical protein